MPPILTSLIKDHYGKRKRHFKFKHNSWCGEFLEFALKNYESRQAVNDKLDLHVAKNWRQVGRKVTNPMTGDIVILHQTDKRSWQGHVGLFVRALNEKIIMVFGGNQSGKVCISPFEISKIDSFRRIVD